MAEETVFGIDSYAAILAVCGVDQAGRRICTRELANNITDHAALLARAREHAPERRFGIDARVTAVSPLRQRVVRLPDAPG